MTYQNWQEAHQRKRQTLQSSLEARGLSKEEIIDYFSFDNMCEKEPDFCVLFLQKVKCHNVKELNCYLCACPYFILHEDQPVQSSCGLGSKFAAHFTVDGNTHCDCTHCSIPHTSKCALKFYTQDTPVKDSCSFLEHLRSFQLWDIFGKYKLF